MSVPATISHAVQQTQEWLKSLCDTGGYAGETEALAVLRDKRIAQLPEVPTSAESGN